MDKASKEPPHNWDVPQLLAVLRQVATQKRSEMAFIGQNSDLQYEIDIAFFNEHASFQGPGQQIEKRHLHDSARGIYPKIFGQAAVVLSTFHRLGEEEAFQQSLLNLNLKNFKISGNKVDPQTLDDNLHEILGHLITIGQEKDRKPKDLKDMTSAELKDYKHMSELQAKKIKHEKGMATIARSNLRGRQSEKVGVDDEHTDGGNFLPSTAAYRLENKVPIETFPLPKKRSHKRAHVDDDDDSPERKTQSSGFMSAREFDEIFGGDANMFGGYTGDDCEDSGKVTGTEIGKKIRAKSANSDPLSALLLQIGKIVENQNSSSSSMAVAAQVQALPSGLTFEQMLQLKKMELDIEKTKLEQLIRSKEPNGEREA